VILASTKFQKKWSISESILKRKMIERACNKYKKWIHKFKKTHRKSYTKKYKLTLKSRHSNVSRLGWPQTQAMTPFDDVVDRWPKPWSHFNFLSYDEEQQQNQLSLSLCLFLSLSCDVISLYSIWVIILKNHKIKIIKKKTHKKMITLYWHSFFCYL
jgi:hypothetical protein